MEKLKAVWYYFVPAGMSLPSVQVEPLGPNLFGIGCLGPRVEVREENLYPGMLGPQQVPPLFRIRPWQGCTCKEARYLEIGPMLSNKSMFPSKRISFGLRVSGGGKTKVVTMTHAKWCGKLAQTIWLFRTKLPKFNRRFRSARQGQHEIWCTKPGTQPQQLQLSRSQRRVREWRCPQPAVDYAESDTDHSCARLPVRWLVAAFNSRKQLVEVAFSKGRLPHSLRSFACLLAQYQNTSDLNAGNL
eukprot:3444790-Rhodomonas_salina.1